MSDPTQPIRPGGGRYRLDSRIATGGMGEVWRATDHVLGREVALKLLKSEYADDPTFRSRFEAEARNAAALHHPNVASVFDVGEMPMADDAHPRPFLVMELVRGEPLSNLLRRGEPMPADRATSLLAQAADGLAAAHALGIVHRDVKPANLLVTPDRTVKITDFGIARAGGSTALTQTGEVIGTPQYLSPEQAQGQPAGPASDVYSLGVVLYECLAGRRPFDGESPVATALSHLRDEPPPLPADVPDRLRRIVAAALAKDPADRFGSMREMADALRGSTPPPPLPRTAPTAVVQAPTRVVGTPPVPVHDEDDPAARRPERRTPVGLLWLAAIVAALLVVVLLIWLSNRSSDRPPADDGPTSTPSASPSPRATPSRTPSSASPTPSDTEPAQVTVTAGNYLGKPADQARQELESLGLEVTQRPVDNPGGKEPGTVAGVDPSGKVDKGSTVTLSVYGAKPTPTESPTTSPTDSSSSSPSSSPTDTGDGDDQ